MRKLYLGHLPELEVQLFKDISAAKHGDPFYPVIVAVESNLVGVYLRRALVRRGSFCRVRFLTLSDLAAELAGRVSDYAFRKTLPPFGEEWLAALTSHEAAGGYFGPVAGRPGFREALLRTFRELEEAGLQQLSLPPGGDPRRIGELQRLFDRYRELRRPFANRADAFAAAMQWAPAEPFMLALHGIHVLSTMEKELLAALSGHAKMSIYMQDASAVLTPVKETLRWCRNQGFKVERLSPPPPAGDNLGRLQRSLFQAPPGKTADPPPVGDESLAFICAPDEIGEVDEITREIIRLARSGVRFGEMAVLPPNYHYGALLIERLAAAGIPCYLAGGQSLARTRTGRSFLLLLELIGGDCPRREMIEFLTYAPIDYSRILGGKRPVSPSLWDDLTMRAGVIKGRPQWREALERCRRQSLIQQGEQEEGSEAGEREGLRGQIAAIEGLQSFLELLFDALDRFGSCRSWRDLGAAAGDFILRFLLPGGEREALHRLLIKLSRLDECGGEFALKTALELLRSALEGTSLPLGRFQQEGVNVLPLDRAAGLCFTAIFIPGLAEKIIPAPVRADPLLPEVERSALAGRLPLRRRELDLEVLRFMLVLGGVLRKAVLTWPRAAVAGREQLPSFFLSRCGEALLGARPGYRQLSLLPGYRYIPAVARAGTVEDPITAVEYDLSCCHDLPPPLQPVQYYRRLSGALSELLEADLARRGRRLNPYEGLFTPGGAPARLLAERLARSGGHVSATALEDYARCPYSYFLKRLLCLAPLGEPAELLRMEPLARGRLIHRILEQFYRQASEKGLLPAERHPGDCRKLLDRLIAGEFEALPQEELPPFPLLRHLQRRYIEETLRAFLDWEIEGAAEFMPVHFELAFGFPESGNEVALGLPSGERLYFRGRIDRIDRSGNRIRVIDYKTGRKRIKDESLAGGEALQLPVYLLAAGAIFNLRQLDETEAYAYHLSPTGVGTSLFSGKPWPQKKRLLQETAAGLYGGIAAGHFFPYPNPGCRFCDYRSICGPEVERAFRLKAADPALAAFLKMKEEKA